MYLKYVKLGIHTTRILSKNYIIHYSLECRGDIVFNSLKSKIIFPVVIVLVLVVGSTFLFVSRTMENLVVSLAEERILGMSQAAEVYLNRRADEQGLLARTFAGSPFLTTSVRNWNMGANQTLVRYDLMRYLTYRKTEFRIDSIVLTDIDDNVILRTHAFDLYGDTGRVSPAIVAASDYGYVTTVYSSTAQLSLGVSAAAPVWDGIGNIIGTVSITTSVDTYEFADDIANTFSAEVTIFLGNERVATTIRDEFGERIIGTLADDYVVNTVINSGLPLLTTLDLLGAEHYAYYIPLFGWFEEPIGMFFIGFSNESTLSAITSMRFSVLIIGVASMFVAVIVVSLLLLGLLKPIVHLTGSVSKLDMVENIAENVTIYGGERLDEIGDLSRTIQQMHKNSQAKSKDLKEMLAMLEDSITREQLANQAKTRFLARMSHEMRTPMNSILGITEIQLQKDCHPAETEEAFTRIYSSSNMLLTLINDILDLSKVEAGKMEILPEVYETASMIIDTVQLNLMYIGSKVIEFKLSVDENLPAYLIGDELRIKQILNNILSNAFKYTLEGTVSLSLALESRINDYVKIAIEISDTGQGMTQEQVDNLWGEFARFNTTANRDIEGTGLGLSIAYQLATMMDGEIIAESQLGVGSKFTVRLTQIASGDNIIGAEAANSMQNLKDTQKSLKHLTKLEREPMPYGRVLVVDDVESNLYVAKGFLIPYKLAVDTADSGILAIERIKEGEIYDIIFMDHMMPELDGVETTKKLREMGYNHPIVALTANAFSDMAEMFMSNGFSGYASKPIDINQMDNHLLKFIRDKQPAEVIEQARMAKATLHTDDKNRLSEMLVYSFLRDAKKAYDILTEFCQYNSTITIEEYTIQAHAMRSALSNIRQKELSNMASKLEQAGRRQDTETIKNETPQFLSKLDEVINELEHGEESEGEDTEENMAFLRNRMQFIFDACDFLDIEAAKEAVVELSNINYSKQTKKLLDDIYELLQGNNFDAAGELAKQGSVLRP